MTCLQKRTGNHGVTLLEITIATSIFSIVMLGVLTFMADTSAFYSVDTTKTHMEWRLQYAMDDVVMDLKETSPLLVEIFDFNDGPDNADQTAIIFPTARQQGTEDFIYTKGGAVQAKPVWQGIVVYAFYTEQAGEPGFLCRYVDYSTSRNYEGGIDIASINSTTITLSDGTTIARDLEGVSGNQFGLRLTSDLRQMVRDPAPPAAVQMPLRLTLRAEKVVDELGGDAVMAQTSTGVMARNKN